MELGALLRSDVELRSEITDAKVELKADIARLEANDLLVKGMLGFLLAAVMAVLFLLLRH